MKQQSSLSSQLSTTSSRAFNARKLWLLLAVLVVLMPSTAADDAIDTGYNDLGKRVMCACKSEPATGFGAKGCQKVLLKCDHQGCDTSGPMRRDLRAALQRGDKDEVILQTLKQTYGATLVASSDISKFAGIVVLTVLAGTVIVIAFVVKRRSPLATVTTPVSRLQDDEK